MNCRRFRFAILESARNETQVSGELQSHLENCPTCMSEFQRQSELSSSLKNLRMRSDNLRPSPKLGQALLNELNRFRSKRGQRNINWMGVVAAALVCISLLSALLWRLKEHPSPAPIAQKQRIQSREITSGFIPLMHGELPGNSVQVIRVRLPRSSLMDLGFPVNMDRPDEMIDADVIIGEEGLPHAIRLIQQSNSVIDFQEER